MRATSARHDCEPLSGHIKEQRYVKLYNCSFYDDLHLYIKVHDRCGPGSSVGIATGYELDGPVIESRGREIFLTCPDRSWGPPSLLHNGYRVFPGGKERPGRDADPSPPSSAVIKKG